MRRGGERVLGESRKGEEGRRGVGQEQRQEQRVS